MTSEKFPGRGRQPLWKHDVKVDNEVALARGVLGVGEALADDAFDGGGLDDFVLEVDHHPLAPQERNVGACATKGLELKIEL